MSDLNNEIAAQLATVKGELLKSFEQKELMNRNIEVLDNNIASYQHTISSLEKLLSTESQEAG